MRLIAYAVLGIVLLAPEAASACHRRRCCDNGQSGIGNNVVWANQCGGCGAVAGTTFYQGQVYPSQGGTNMPHPATGGGTVAPMPNPKK